MIVGKKKKRRKKVNKFSQVTKTSPLISPIFWTFRGPQRQQSRWLRRLWWLSGIWSAGHSESNEGKCCMVPQPSLWAGSWRGGESYMDMDREREREREGKRESSEQESGEAEMRLACFHALRKTVSHHFLCNAPMPSQGTTSKLWVAFWWGQGQDSYRHPHSNIWETFCIMVNEQVAISGNFYDVYELS